jgi:Fe-Mn family superoxide dismutase
MMTNIASRAPLRAVAVSIPDTPNYNTVAANIPAASLEHNPKAMTEPKPLKYEDLPGISARQLAEHHGKLYVGYCKKTDAIRERLAAADVSGANATYDDFRELKLEEGFAANGVRLHEAYFESLSPRPTGPSDTLTAWVAEDFGSMDAWAEDFAAVAMSARGWAVLAFDLHDGKLHNYLADAHNQGGVWGAVPLIVMDVYEHAYFLDFVTARKRYLDTLHPLIDWKSAAETVDRLGLAAQRR